MAKCPVCGESTTELNINVHLDKGCPKPKVQQKRQWSFLTGKSDQSKPTESAKTGVAQANNAMPTGSIPPASSGSSGEAEVANTPPSDSIGSSQAEDVKQPFGTEANPSDPIEPRSSEETPRKKPKGPTDNLAPLAEKMRPSVIDEYVGQAHLMGPQGILRKIMETPNSRIPSMVLWGPSGVGKTTLARVMATQVQAKFIELSAPSAGSNDVKRIITDARKDWQLIRRRTVLFLDEIHRFNRSQQDSLLAGVERGDIILIGATTENPSFKLSGALLSRLRVFVLEKLSREELRAIVERAIIDRATPGTPAEISTETLNMVVDAASSTGDARQALNMLETVRALPEGADPKLVLKHTLVHDQRGEKHYDLISAFHKSVRGGDADAALYYLARMLSGGEDPLYVSRRLMRIASEDIGLADDSCLPFAVAVHTTVQQVGMPECDAMLAHAAVKFARAPKSVEVYKALGLVLSDIEGDATVGGAPIPMHLRNAPTKLMKDVGYGAHYKYNPKFKGEVKQEYLPAELTGRKWLGVFQPTEEDTE